MSKKLPISKKADFRQRLRRFGSKQIHHIGLVFQPVGKGVPFHMGGQAPRIFIADGPDDILQLVNILLAPVQPCQYAECADSSPAREITNVAVLVLKTVAGFMKKFEPGIRQRRNGRSAAFFGKVGNLLQIRFEQRIARNGKAF